MTHEVQEPFRNFQRFQSWQADRNYFVENIMPLDNNAQENLVVVGAISLLRHLGFSPSIELHEGGAPADGRLGVHKGSALDDLAVLRNNQQKCDERSGIVARG